MEGKGKGSYWRPQPYKSKGNYKGGSKGWGKSSDGKGKGKARAKPKTQSSATVRWKEVGKTLVSAEKGGEGKRGKGKGWGA